MPSIRHLGACLGVTLSVATACGSHLDVAPMVPEKLDSAFVRVSDCGKSEHPRRDHVVTWISRDAEPHWRAGTRPLPVGTVLVKVQYADASCRELARYTAMRKDAVGTAPASGDWTWQLLDTRRGVRQHGDIKGCVSCHKVCDAEDWVCTIPKGDAAPTPAAQPALPDDF